MYLPTAYHKMYKIPISKTKRNRVLTIKEIIKKIQSKRMKVWVFQENGDLKVQYQIVHFFDFSPDIIYKEGD